MTSFRRGFKTEAERISIEVRSELNLTSCESLDPQELASHLNIPVIPMSSLPQTEESSFVRFFSVTEPDTFSAMTLFSGNGRVIIFNDAHHLHRQRSNVAHEIGHCLLEHVPSALTDSSGCRNWNDQFESEADWLGASLLVPRDGALALLRRGMSISEVAAIFRVSDALCRWRINQTGLERQVRSMARIRRS